MTKVLKCTCKNVHQDKLHGSNMRVFNSTSKSNGDEVKFRCTVCCSEAWSKKK